MMIFRSWKKTAELLNRQLDEETRKRVKAEKEAKYTRQALLRTSEKCARLEDELEKLK